MHGKEIAEKLVQELVERSEVKHISNNAVHILGQAEFDRRVRDRLSYASLKRAKMGVISEEITCRFLQAHNSLHADWREVEDYNNSKQKELREWAFDCLGTVAGKIFPIEVKSYDINDDKRSGYSISTTNYNLAREDQIFPSCLMGCAVNHLTGFGMLLHYQNYADIRNELLMNKDWLTGSDYRIIPFSYMKSIQEWKKDKFREGSYFTNG